MATLDAPAMHAVQEIDDHWTALPSWLPVPGMGALAINSFVLKGREPLLVDTGLGALGDAYIGALEQVVDPTDLRWIWVSHLDADHIGNLARVLEIAPRAQIVTNFLGVGKMGLAGLDVTRVHMLQPGDVLETADRRLIPVRPPYYDAPETIGFFSEQDRVFFAADSFGALLPEPVEEVAALDPTVLRDGLVGWSSIDAPWLATADPRALGRMFDAVERLDPAHVLSGHLPLTRGSMRPLTRILADAYGRGPTAAIDPLAVDAVADALG